jgi:hypothetical protein
MDPFLDSPDEIPDYFNTSQNGFFGEETIPLYIKLNYDIRKLKAGLSLDEEFLILAGRSLVRKIRPAILFSDADHDLQCSPLYGTKLSTVWNGWKLFDGGNLTGDHRLPMAALDYRFPRLIRNRTGGYQYPICPSGPLESLDFITKNLVGFIPIKD